MIDRIRLTAAAKTQLSTIKRRTGIEHYNAICRHALCLSLANATIPPKEDFSSQGGVEIDWRTFTGANEALYTNLVIQRQLADGGAIDAESVRRCALAHTHRGLSYLASQKDNDLLLSLAKSIISIAQDTH